MSSFIDSVATCQIVHEIQMRAILIVASYEQVNLGKGWEGKGGEGKGRDLLYSLSFLFPLRYITSVNTQVVPNSLSHNQFFLKLF